MSSVLVLVASKAINAQQLTALPSLENVPLDAITVATNSSSISVADLEASKFGKAVTIGPAGHHSISLLAAIASALTPGGTLIVHEDGNSSSEILQKNLMFSGFTNSVSLQQRASLVESRFATTFSATKPSWETGAKAAISLNTHKSNGKTSDIKGAKWTLNVDDEDEELVNEDDLLTAEDLARPVPANDDCEVGAGGRKACENCTCGRAEGEVKKLTKDMIENPTSGCGSCALGDAFRCGGCPYRGLPAFELGKKIELPPDFLMADLE